MIRVDYHLHTSSSYDSKMTAEATLERAQAAHLDILCITDHDTIDGAVKLSALRPPNLQVVVGCEFTCEDGSHVIGLGLKDMIDAKDVHALLEAIKHQGARVLLPHLFRRGSGIFRRELRRSPEFVREVLALADLVECFNGRDSYEHNRQSYRFAIAHALPSVVGSDAHTSTALGSVFVEYDDPAPIDGLSSRRIFFPSQPPAFESPAKRALLELYHRHQRHFPSAVRWTYRALKRFRSPDRDRSATPQFQYAFPMPGPPPS